MTRLTWQELLLLALLIVSAAAAGAEHPLLALGFLLVAAYTARVLVVAARARERAQRRVHLTPLQQRQREQLVAGRWS